MLFVTPSYYTQSNSPSSVFTFSANFVYSNTKTEIKEDFINIIAPFLFLFSLLDPLTWLVNEFMLKRYNKNCRDLYISNKLYYV